MQPCRILVLYNKSLYAQTVASLLKKSDDLEVIGLELDESEVLKSISSIQPDAVIVDCNDLKEYGNSLILQILRECPESKVLCIAPNQNSIDIFRKSQVEVTAADELVQAIRSR